jgi:hypothetical protein
MRLILLCTALCIACPLESSAGLWHEGNLVPKATSFAYRASHATGGLPAGNVRALRPAGVSASELAAIKPVAAASPPGVPRAFSKGELCSAAASVAEANNLPVPFFANLIQQESGFKPHVVSPAGAQGIAQFMPRVAMAYGLTNPFDPIHALVVSGRFLAELVAQFGNLGLAAAAYNAGPKRVQDFIAKRRKLPAETRNYVQNITGRPAEQWTRSASADEPVRMPPHARCPDAETIEAQEAERAKAMVAHASARPQDRIALNTQPRDRTELSAQRVKRPRAAFAARSGRKSVIAAAGPAAQRFVVWVTPSIIAPERRAERVRVSRKPSLANTRTANTRTGKALASKNGPAVATKRLRMAAAR